MTKHRYLPLDDFDHGILSPSGRVSKRTSVATLKILAQRVNDAKAEADQAGQAALEIQRPKFLRQYAADLRALADRGMRPKKHRALAAALEAEAKQLERD